MMSMLSNRMALGTTLTHEALARRVFSFWPIRLSYTSFTTLIHTVLAATKPSVAQVESPTHNLAPLYWPRRCA